MEEPEVLARGRGACGGENLGARGRSACGGESDGTSADRAAGSPAAGPARGGAARQPRLRVDAKRGSRRPVPCPSAAPGQADRAVSRPAAAPHNPLRRC